jgi:hypothetical protein
MHEEGDGRRSSRAARERALSRKLSVAPAALAVAVLGFALAAPAGALITPAVTVAGPEADILDFGGVAMAPDGTGGLVFTEAVEGVPHVFASRFVGGAWSAPIRVDWDQPFEGGQARIAAGPRGELLVVWVTQVATVKNRLRFGLFAAKLGHGASSFGPSELIDANVGEGVGVDPSLSGTRPGQAIVAYRAITFDFSGNTFSNAVQLRPGDVMADIRLARLRGDRWARIGAVNRNPEASMRPPSPTNGPQVATAPDGSAAVAWQEPDQTGAARIWLRRVFGTTPGPVLEASPASWQGAPVSADADAFSLGLSPLAQVGVAFHIAAGPGSALSGRLLYNSLPSTDALGAATLNGAVLADGGAAPAGGSGPPDVSVGDEGGPEGSLRLGFLAGAEPRLMGIDSKGTLVGVPLPAGPPAQAGTQPVAAIGPEGGGLLAYASTDAAGRPAVEVRQEFASGAVQTGLVSGSGGGPVAELAIGRAGAGDALIAFRQGEPGRLQIVAERVSAPPAAFAVKAPAGWIRPRRARLRWQAAASAVGGISYAVLLDGRAVARGLRRRAFRPPPGQLGNGIRQVRVLATDALGEQLLSRPAKLRVDGQAPVVRVKRGGHRRIAIRVADPDSGMKSKATLVRFGDGERARGGGDFHHAYARPGRYTVVVRAIDRVGNRLRRRFEVGIR